VHTKALTLGGGSEKPAKKARGSKGEKRSIFHGSHSGGGRLGGENENDQSKKKQKKKKNKKGERRIMEPGIPTVMGKKKKVGSPWGRTQPATDDSEREKKWIWRPIAEKKKDRRSYSRGRSRKKKKTSFFTEEGLERVKESPETSPWFFGKKRGPSRRGEGRLNSSSKSRQLFREARDFKKASRIWIKKNKQKKKTRGGKKGKRKRKNTFEQQ